MPEDAKPIDFPTRVRQKLRADSSLLTDEMITEALTLADGDELAAYFDLLHQLAGEERP